MRKFIKSDNPYKVSVTMHTDTNLFFGENSAIEQNGKPISISVAEAKSVIIGDNCCFGSNVWIRTSDQHAIYDMKTLQRINKARDVVLNNGTVLPADKLILKGFNNCGDDNEKLTSLASELDKTTDMDKRAELMKKLR